LKSHSLGKEPVIQIDQGDVSFSNGLKEPVLFQEIVMLGVPNIRKMGV
jgi:hypothetical protein